MSLSRDMDEKAETSFSANYHKGQTKHRMFSLGSGNWLWYTWTGKGNITLYRDCCGLGEGWRGIALGDIPNAK